MKHPINDRPVMGHAIERKTVATRDLSRRDVLAAGVAAGAALTAPALMGQAQAQTQAQTNDTFRIAISLLDIPKLWGSADGGFEGMRFGGYPIYDALINWNLKDETGATTQPGLATAWAVDPADKRRWIVTLREGVRFHDGSPCDADAVVWNFQSVLDNKVAQYDPGRAAITRSRIPSIVRAEKIDAKTIAVITDAPDAMTPPQLTYVLMVSPAHFAKLGNDWVKFAANPSGTGPFKVVTLVPRARVELVRNDDYWDKSRVPKCAALTMVPVPDPSSRVAALRAGQVDFIESVPPDTIASLKGAGLRVITHLYPHMWNWRLSTLPGSPFADVRVRRAMNLAIDRGGIVEILSGTAVPAKGLYDQTSPWFGKPTFNIRTDVTEAKRLLAEAGVTAQKRIKAKVLISNSGGGQMQPLPMNEFIQANLADVGIDVEFVVVDFITLFTAYRNGVKAASSAGISAINVAAPTQEPASSLLRGFLTDYSAPRGTNWSFYSNPEVDRYLRIAQESFEVPALNAALAAAHERVVDDAAALFVVHDTNPRALSNRVKGFIQPSNWFADFTSVSVT